MSDNTTDNGIARQFSTGATRDTSDGKLDYEGFLCPFVLECYAEYMHENRVQSDGKLRPSDNWQNGIPREEYMKSMWRHFHAVWKKSRSEKDAIECKTYEEFCEQLEKELNDIFGLMFNVMGFAHETLKEMGKME